MNDPEVTNAKGYLLLYNILYIYICLCVRGKFVTGAQRNVAEKWNLDGIEPTDVIEGH